MTGRAKLLWDYASMVYPPKSTATNLSVTGPLNAAAYSRFDPARRNLAKFWNQWGAKVFLYDWVSLQDITEDFFPTHYRTVKLLCYLESALVRKTGAFGEGKKWLFKLGSEWSKKERSKSRLGCVKLLQAQLGKLASKLAAEVWPKENWNEKELRRGAAAAREGAPEAP